MSDVTFQFNEVRNVGGGVSVLGYDSPNVSAQTTAVVIRHNLFHGITKTLGTGWFLLIGDEPRDVTLDHNTIDFDGTTAVYAYGGTDVAPRQIAGFRFVNNALPAQSVRNQRRRIVVWHPGTHRVLSGGGGAGKLAAGWDRVALSVAETSSAARSRRRSWTSPLRITVSR